MIFPVKFRCTHCIFKNFFTDLRSMIKKNIYCNLRSNYTMVTYTYILIFEQGRQVQERTSGSWRQVCKYKCYCKVAYYVICRLLITIFYTKILMRKIICGFFSRVKNAHKSTFQIKNLA